MKNVTNYLLKFTSIILFFISACETNNKILNTEILVELDTTFTTIGTPINYKVTVNSASQKIIQFTEWDLDQLLEVRSFSVKETDLGKVGQYELVFWDTGKVSIPGLKINFLNTDSILDFSLITDSLDVEIISINEKEPSLQISSNGDILPIKDPVPVKFPLPWKNIFRLLSLLLIFFWIIYIWKKRIKVNVSFEEKQKFKDKPNIVALSKLEKLNKSSLSKNNNIKELYVELSHILREYIENSLFIRALEMTTEEIKFSNNHFPYSDLEFMSLVKILSNSDMAKYARYNASIKELSSDLTKTIDLVNDTTRYWNLEFS